MKNSIQALLSKGYYFSFFFLFFIVQLLLLFFLVNAFAEDMGPALRFTSPEQRVEIAPFPKATNGTFTIEFRMKIEEAGSGLQNLVGDADGSFDYCFKIYLNGDNRKLYAYLQTTSSIFILISTSTIESGLWYHVAYAADGTKLTLYLNGDITAQVHYSGNLVNTDNAFYIGSDESEKAPLATIDEVRIWNTALIEWQIKHYMFSRIKPDWESFAALDAYWQLDEGGGDAAIDATVNHRNGIFRGTPKWVELEACSGDFMGDSFVDGSDLASFVTVFGLENCGSEKWTHPGDFNADGNINELDLKEFASCFGRDDCTTKHVFAIVDVMVAEDTDSWWPRVSSYTGLRFGECTGPYIPNLIGYQMEAVDVNTGIGGTTTGIWAKYAHMPVNWTGPVLTDIAVTHWVEWNVSCYYGWQPASGTSSGIPGALTTRTKGSCWRNGLCVRYEPFSKSDTFISNLCLSFSNGTLPAMCTSNDGYWPMESDGLDIHRACGDERYVYLGHNHAETWPSMPQKIDYNDEEKYALLKTYAPRVWFKGDERYWPSSVEWAFPYFKRVLHSDGYWLHTKEALESPSDGTLPVFSGNLETAPVYAYFINKQIPFGEISLEVVDLVYFFYYPYNRGKEVINTIFGSHVSDWEHITVRLTLQYDYSLGWEMKPYRVYLPAHSFGTPYNWNDPRLQKVSDTHPVVYSAWGSHGLWIDPGEHKYDEVCYLLNCEDLVDWCDAGIAWDTWENIVAFDYYDPSNNNGRGLGGSQWPAWMSNDFTNPGCQDLGSGCDQNPAIGAIYRWGNPAWGEVFGYDRLADGPTGPVLKEVMWSPELQ